MTWKIIIQMPGDFPSLAEVETAETEVEQALDSAGIDYVDIYSD